MFISWTWNCWLKKCHLTIFSGLIRYENKTLHMIRTVSHPIMVWFFHKLACVRLGNPYLDLKICILWFPVEHKIWKPILSWISLIGNPFQEGFHHRNPFSDYVFDWNPKIQIPDFPIGRTLSVLSCVAFDELKCTVARGYKNQTSGKRICDGNWQWQRWRGSEVVLIAWISVSLFSLLIVFI